MSLQSEVEVPSYFVHMATYCSYMFLILIGHVRDFFGKRFFPQEYFLLTEHDVSFSVFELLLSRQFFRISALTNSFLYFQGYAPLTAGFETFFSRRIKQRFDDVSRLLCPEIDSDILGSVSLDQLLRFHHELRPFSIVDQKPLSLPLTFLVILLKL